MTKKKLYEGQILVNRKGFAFLDVKDKDVISIFIPYGRLKGCMNGDTVQVEIVKRSNKGYEGVVHKIIKREHKNIVCIITQKVKNGYYCHSPLLGSRAKVLLKHTKFLLNEGDRILSRFKKYNSKTRIFHVTLGSKDGIIGSVYDPKSDIQSAMITYNIRNKFSEDIKEELKKHVIEPSSKRRKDLTDISTITIDPPDAKDYDDALSITSTKSGYTLYVHIADVSHFVKTKSKIDKEASLRGNSTYFLGCCSPMLPFKLSNDLCSLVENEERMTVTVEMHFNKSAKLQKSSIYRSKIKSDKRLTYKEAMDILDKEKGEFYDDLLQLKELALLLLKEKEQRGSVPLDTEEVRLILDNSDNPIDTEIINYDITHQMVEMFMIKANEIVAKQLSSKIKRGIYRVHEKPDVNTIRAFASFAKQLGYNLSEEPTQNELIKFFSSVEDKTHMAILTTKFIRSMKMAIYTQENLGHYGLALQYYTHFTSPIRRYSDLIVHRLLLNEDDPKDNLADLADSLCKTERNSFKAEMEVLNQKQLRYLQHLFNKDKNKIYPAVISKISKRGISCDLSLFQYECSITDLSLFNIRNQDLVHNKTLETFSIGSKINLQLVGTDLLYMNSKWKIVDPPPKLC